MESNDYQQSIDLLAAELDQVEAWLDGLEPADWERSTSLVPYGDGLAPWTLKGLVAHIDISIGLTGALLASIQNGQPGRDRVSFFIADRSEVAPAVYSYANALAAEHTIDTLMARVRQTFTDAVEGPRQHSPESIGSGYFALMRLDEWVPTRVVEAVVHGMDVADTLGRPASPTAPGLEMTARILDELLARRTTAARPTDLIEDDLAWVRAASGRGPHHDPRLPLIG
jgi:hypothetical protein